MSMFKFIAGDMRACGCVYESAEEREEGEKDREGESSKFLF